MDDPRSACPCCGDLMRRAWSRRKVLAAAGIGAVGLNSAGHIFVLHRGNSTGPAYAAAAAQLLEFDGNGDYLREIGHNLYAWSFAHTVKVDREDNVWVT